MVRLLFSHRTCIACMGAYTECPVTKNQFWPNETNFEFHTCIWSSIWFQSNSLLMGEVLMSKQSKIPLLSLRGGAGA